MMRVLGIDYGQKRIGLAVSDPLGITAQPIGIVAREPKPFDEIAKIVAQYEVTAFVVGNPLSLQGGPTAMSQEIALFVERLRERFQLDVHLYDERLTSREVEQTLISADVRRSRRKEVRDTMAASLILQGFLASGSFR